MNIYRRSTPHLKSPRSSLSFLGEIKNLLMIETADPNRGLQSDPGEAL